jgi:uncharacterized membrane protein
MFGISLHIVFNLKLLRYLRQLVSRLQTARVQCQTCIYLNIINDTCSPASFNCHTLGIL